MHPTPDPTDDELGIPRPGGGRRASTTSTAEWSALPPLPPPPEPEPELRPGETDLGRPPQTARDLAPLTDADRKAIAADEQAKAARELAEAEELLASDPAVLRWAGVFAHPLAAAFLLAAAGTLGLFVYSQALTVLANLAAQPPAVQYAGYALLAVLAGAVVVAGGRVLILYMMLRRNRQVRLAGLEELAGRTRLRWLAHAKSAEAKARLEEYLRTYPLDPGRRTGLPDDTVAELEKARAALLDPGRFASSAQWFDQFRDTFQARLDAAANARVRYWSNRAWVVTALAPNGLYDSLATTYFGFAMIGDLCRVYNLRAGRSGTAVLLGRVFFNAYLSGQVGDWEKLAEDQYDQLFLEACHVAGVSAGTSVVGKVLGKVGAKATTGYLNRVLLTRLGNYACRLLRPVN
jgi:hypothetical protein